MAPGLQVGKLRLRDVKSFAEGDTARTCTAEAKLPVSSRILTLPKYPQPLSKRIILPQDHSGRTGQQNLHPIVLLPTPTSQMTTDNQNLRRAKRG